MFCNFLQERFPNKLFFDDIFTECCRKLRELRQIQHDCQRSVHYPEFFSNILKCCEIKPKNLHTVNKISASYSAHKISGESSKFNLMSYCYPTAPTEAPHGEGAVGVDAAAEVVDAKGGEARPDASDAPQTWVVYFGHARLEGRRESFFQATNQTPPFSIQFCKVLLKIISQLYLFWFFWHLLPNTLTSDNHLGFPALIFWQILKTICWFFNEK